MTEERDYFLRTTAQGDEITMVVFRTTNDDDYKGLTKFIFSEPTMNQVKKLI